MHVCDLRDQFLLGLDSRYALHFGLQRRDALFLDGRLVHTGRIIVADLDFDGAVVPRSLSLLEDVAQSVQVVLVQCVEAAPPRLVGWNGIVLHPVAAGVLIEIHAGIRGFIHGCYIETGDLFGGLGGRRIRGRCLGGGENRRKQYQESQESSNPHFCLARILSPCGKLLQSIATIGRTAFVPWKEETARSTGNTTTRAVRLRNWQPVSRDKVLLPLRRSSNGWSGISWGPGGRPRSGSASPPAIGRHCYTTKDLPGTCRRCLRPYPAGRRCYSGE